MASKDKKSKHSKKPSEAERADPKVARGILRQAFPDNDDYCIVRDQLRDSFREAENTTEHGWAVTLHRNRVRLNVGRVEAFSAFEGRMLLLLHGLIPRGLKGLAQNLHRSRLKSVSREDMVFAGTPKQFDRYRKHLIPAHHDFIAEAGTRKNGQPVRGTPYRSSHSPGVVLLVNAKSDSPNRR
jgi:hypothetical protein